MHPCKARRLSLALTPRPRAPHAADASVAAAGKKGKKKKRKSEGGEAAASPADDPLYGAHDWRLRLKVVRALHRCFLYDTGAGGTARFLDDARFQRLLPPLVEHLGLRPPPALAPALEADGATDGAADLEASLALGAAVDEQGGGDAAAASPAGQLDAFGRAVVACLAQLAVTAGSDAQWKPLNHQVRAPLVWGSAHRAAREKKETVGGMGAAPLLHLAAPVLHTAFSFRVLTHAPPTHPVNRRCS